MSEPMTIEAGDLSPGHIGWRCAKPGHDGCGRVIVEIRNTATGVLVKWIDADGGWDFPDWFGRTETIAIRPPATTYEEVQP